MAEYNYFQLLNLIINIFTRSGPSWMIFNS